MNPKASDASAQVKDNLQVLVNWIFLLCHVQHSLVLFAGK